MASPCYYHPDTIASATCVQCGLPICATCTDRVGEKTVCHKCVQVVKSRLEAQMASAPAGAYSPPQGQYGTPLPNSGGQSFGGTAVVLPPQSISTAQWLAGIGLALVIGIVGAIAVEKFETNLHIGLSLLYIGVGYGVAWGLLKGTGRGGVPMAVVAMLIMLVGIGAGLLAEASDVLGIEQARGVWAANTPLTYALSYVISHEGFMHWVLVAIGVYSCFQTVARQR